MLGLSWRSGEGPKMGRSAESSSSTVGGSGYGIFGGTDILGGEAWGPPNGHVRKRRVGVRTKVMDGGGLHLPDQEFAAARRRRDRQSREERGIGAASADD